MKGVVVATLRHGLGASREGIVHELRARGTSSADDLADALGVTKQCVRKHLEVLEREGYVEHAAARGDRGRPAHVFRLTPKAYRLFQSKLLTHIFEQLQESRSGRHQGPIIGEGATELQQTKPYEFGDSVAQMDIPASMTNALLRDGPKLPVRMKPEDIVIHRTRVTPKAAKIGRAHV